MAATRDARGAQAPRVLRRDVAGCRCVVRPGGADGRPLELRLPARSRARGSMGSQPHAQVLRPLDALVALQRADGSWELDGEFAKAVSLKLRQLEKELRTATGDPETVRRALATAIALEWLEKHAAAQRGEWELLAAEGDEVAVGLTYRAGGGPGLERVARRRAPARLTARPSRRRPGASVTLAALEADRHVQVASASPASPSSCSRRRAPPPRPARPGRSRCRPITASSSAQTARRSSGSPTRAGCSSADSIAPRRGGTWTTVERRRSTSSR